MKQLIIKILLLLPLSSTVWASMRTCNSTDLATLGRGAVLRFLDADTNIYEDLGLWTSIEGSEVQEGSLCETPDHGMYLYKVKISIFDRDGQPPTKKIVITNGRLRNSSRPGY